MEKNMTLEPDEIRSCVLSAADRLHQLRPAYQKILAFYGPLFVEQERRAALLPTPDTAPIPPQAIDIKRKHGFSRFSVGDFPVNAEAGAELFHWICDRTKELSGPLADAGACLQSAFSADRRRLSELFCAITDGNDDRVQEIAEDLSVDRDILALFAYHSIRPSLVAFARSPKILDQIPDDWRRGICPVCGSFPVLSLFGEEGRRELVCGFCWHQWPYRRVACPFCHTTDGKRLRYFFDENEPESRVDLCDGCRRYLKAVDTRNSDRAIYPPLEALTTLHLDIKAQDLGFKGGVKPKL